MLFFASQDEGAPAYRGQAAPPQTKEKRETQQTQGRGLRSTFPFPNLTLNRGPSRFD